MIRLALPLPCAVNKIWRTVEFPLRLSPHKTVWKQRTILSKTARNRCQAIIAAVWDQCGGRPVPMQGPVMVQGYFHPTKHRNGALPDADAYTKHLLDCLAKAGVYLDDKQVAASPFLERLEPKAKGSMTIEVWEITA